MRGILPTYLPKTMMMNEMLTLLFVIVMGMPLSACSNLRQVRVLHGPLTPAEHVTLGLSYQIEGRPELATREYDRALRQQHGFVPALLGLGNLAFGRGAFSEAEAYFLQALAVAPEDPSANNNLAMLYVARGRNIEEAEQLAIHALAKGGPLQPYALDTMAHIYVLKGRYREALAALKNAETLVTANDKLLHEELALLRQELMDSHPRANQDLETEL